MRGSTKVLEYIPYPPPFPPSPRPTPPLLTHAMTHAAHLTSCMCTHRVINTWNRRAFSLSIPTHRLTREKLLVLAASERLSLAVSQSAGVHAYRFLSVYILLTQRERKREREKLYGTEFHMHRQENFQSQVVMLQKLRSFNTIQS